MSLEMVFNELSLRQPVQNVEAARRVMKEFISTVRTAGEFGLSATLRADLSIHELLLAPAYPVVLWRNDPAVDLDERRYFRLINSKVPGVAGLPEIAVLLNLQEFRFQGD